MRYSMHLIDLGAIVHLIRGILRKFHVCVEVALDARGLAERSLNNTLNVCWLNSRAVIFSTQAKIWFVLDKFR
jgi:hypothetical protein